MKKLIVFIIFALNLTFSSCVFSQNKLVSNADLVSLNVEWKGQLTYLNYKDDKTTFHIPCSIKTNFEEGQLNSKIIFDELDKDGNKMVNEGSFKISKDGKYFLLGKEKWEISSNEKKDEVLQIIANKKGEDKNQPADLKITLTIEKNKSISWKKDVRYEGTDSFFNRNQFTFSNQ